MQPYSVVVYLSPSFKIRKHIISQAQRLAVMLNFHNLWINDKFFSLAYELNRFSTFKSYRNNPLFTFPHICLQLLCRLLFGFSYLAIMYERIASWRQYQSVGVVGSEHYQVSSTHAPDIRVSWDSSYVSSARKDFPKAGEIVSRRRASLKLSTVDMLVYGRPM